MDEGQGLGQGADVSSEPSAISQAPSAPVADSSSNERTFRQNEVNDIVKRAKNDAVENFKRLSEQQPSYAQQKYGEIAQGRERDASQSGSTSEQDIRRLAAEEAQRLRNEWIADHQSKTEASEAQRIVNNFYNKIAPGKDSYEDFDSVVGDIEYARFPNVVQILSEHVDNAHDVLYELGKDRFKMAQLEQLSQMSPKDALVQARRLADSIKNNQQASKVRTPNQPLSQMRPSNTGTDGGALSVGDYRKRYRV